MIKHTFVQIFLKQRWNHIELQSLNEWNIRLFSAEKCYPFNRSKTITIFWRISDLLGEPLAKIIRWVDRISKRGSNMAMDWFRPGIPTEILTRLGCLEQNGGRRWRNTSLITTKENWNYYFWSGADPGIFQRGIPPVHQVIF